MTSSRTILWSVNDGVNASAPATSHVSISNPNPNPTTLAPYLGYPVAEDERAVGVVAGERGDAVGVELLGPNPGPSWLEVGVGAFFSGDTSDLLWQNAGGAVDIWQMHNDAFVSSALVANPGPHWHVEGTGDFNGDGATDILLQKDSGDVAVWEMKGSGQLSQSVEVANPGSSWQVAGTADFNGDGATDIVLQRNTGDVAVWEMNGSGQISKLPKSPTLDRPGASSARATSTAMAGPTFCCREILERSPSGR